MKNLRYIFILAVILLASCKDDEATPNYLNGTYENSGFNSETGISYVSQYIFAADGSYERISFLREEGQNLGYNFYSKGSYTLRGEEFSMQDGQMAGVNYDEYPEGYVETLDLLEDYSIEPTVSKGVLRQLEGGEKIAILMECNDVIVFSSMCIGELIYDKVD